jgi:hypothetical protein
VHDSITRVIELTYGKDDDKKAALSSISQMSKDPKNIEIMIRHPVLLPALARLLTENLDLSATVLIIIASFSVFSDFHDDLLKNHIGLSIMTTLNRLMSQYNTLASYIDVPKIIQKSLIVLDHLSDDPSRLRKMMKKGLISLLFQCLQMDYSILLELIAKLLLKSSVYEELITCSIDKKEDKGLHVLIKAHDMITRKNALLILYNMSFFESFHHLLQIHNLYMEEILLNIKQRINMNESLKILYRITKTKETRLAVASPEYIDAIMGVFLGHLGQNDAIEICAIVVNVSPSTCLLLNITDEYKSSDNHDHWYCLW